MILLLLIKAQLLFVNAWSGYDTTFVTFGQGKTTLLKIKESNKLQQILYLMNNANASPEQIGKADIQVFIMCDGKQGGTLTTL